MNTRYGFRFLIAAAMLAATIATTAPTQAQTPPKYNLGISVSGNDYGARTWTNMAKADSRLWIPGSTNPAPMDANSYPTTDCDVFLLDGGYAQNVNRMGSLRGTYKLYFTGQADIPSAGGGTLQNKQYDAVSNTTTADYVVTTDYPSISFAFRNTRRTATSAVGSGVTNIKLMRPVSIGSTTSYAQDTVFTTEYLAAHNRGSVLRMMDLISTNGNVQKEWSSRRRPEEMAYYNAPEGGYGWQGKGAPWESCIQLCNTLNKDLWINVPTYASDDYVRQLARLIKTNLNPGLNVYVEYSNEIWNFSFAQFNQVSGLARADIQANPSTSINFDGACINTDGTTNSSTAVPRFWARRVLQISDIFRSEFGDAAMLTRVRPLFETQSAWQTWIASGMIFLDIYYNNGAGNFVATPRPISSYIWGGGGSGYISGYPGAVKDNPSATTDSIIAGYSQAWPEHYQTMANDTYWCSVFGLKRVAYEAGTGLDDFAGPDSAIQTAQRDPRMQAIYQRTADEFFKAGGELYATFLGVNSAHGLLPFDSVVGTQPRPKQLSFDAMAAAASRPAPTVGVLVPAVIPAGRFNIRENGYSVGADDNPVSLNDAYSWLGYTVRVGTAGSYTLALPGATGTAAMRVEIDGKIAGSLAVPGSGTVPLGSLAAGVHGIRLVKTSGSVSVASLDIKAGGGTVGTGTGLTGTYFADKTLTTAAGNRTDATVNFDWGTGNPGVAGVGVDSFSARWEGSVQAPVTGAYTFTTTSDDGVRLWINGTQLVNNWTDHAAIDDSGTITLTAGMKYTIKMEYFESGGGAVAKLNWAYPGQARQAIPQTQLYAQQNRPNLITNPGYENGGLANWLGGGNYSLVTTGARTGTNAGQVNGGYASLYQAVSGLKPNTSYTFTVWAKASDTSGRVVLFAQNFGGTNVSKTVTSAGYTQSTMTFTTGATNTSAQVGCGELNGSATTITVDDWTLTEN